MKLTMNIECGPNRADMLIYKHEVVGQILSLRIEHNHGEWAGDVVFKMHEDYVGHAESIMRELAIHGFAAVFETGSGWDPQTYFKNGRWMIEFIPAKVDVISM